MSILRARGQAQQNTTAARQFSPRAEHPQCTNVEGLEVYTYWTRGAQTRSSRPDGAGSRRLDQPLSLMRHMPSRCKRAPAEGAASMLHRVRLRARMRARVRARDAGSAARAPSAYLCAFQACECMLFS